MLQFSCTNKENMTAKDLYLSWSHATGKGVSKEDALSWSAAGKAQLHAGTCFPAPLCLKPAFLSEY